MASKIRVKRGTTAAVHASTPEQGEPLWDRSRRRLHIGDGATLGGVMVGPFAYERWRRIGWWGKNPGATTVTTVGLPTPTLTGVSSSVDVAGANGQPLLEHIASGGVGTGVGIIATPWLSIDWSVELYARIRAPASIGNIRLWLGLLAGDPSAVSDPGTLGMAALWYDSGVHGTASWRALTSNGTGAGVYTETDTGVSISGGSYHNWWIEATRDTEPVRFYHDGVLKVEHSTNVPASGTLLSPSHWVSQLTGTARRCRWNRLVIAHR